MPLFLTPEPANAVMQALAEALDRVDFGIVLLSPDLGVRFVNERQIEMWGLPRALLNDRPAYRVLMDHVGSRQGYHVAPAALSAYLDARENAIRAGAVPPARIDLADGRRVSFQCIVTADGGRMLTYIDITRSTREQELQQEARDAAERLGAELRFSNESLESQAAYLASLAEAADDAARNADQAKRRLEQEMAERLGLEAELRRLATTDALTGALNRAHLLALGERELTRVRRLDQELAVVMLDVDHFKAINDQYGHAAGDAALKQVVQRLRGGVRQIDLVGRVGGEEFVVVLPAITQQGAMLVSERLRTAIACHPIQHDGLALPLTVSLGVAMARGSDRGLEQVLARADAALYTAKHSGRNRIAAADEPLTASMPRFGDELQSATEIYPPAEPRPSAKPLADHLCPTDGDLQATGETLSA